jgi:hypothetical protein
MWPDDDGRVDCVVPTIPSGDMVTQMGLTTSDTSPLRRKVIEVVRGDETVRWLSLEDLQSEPRDGGGAFVLRID